MTLAEMFADYLAAAYPDLTIEGTQLTEVRRSFYAGAWSILTSLPAAALSENLKQLVCEAMGFCEDVKAGTK